MNRGRFSAVWSTTLTLELIGAIGHQLAYQIQENFYGTPNLLKPVFDALGGFQLSITSYFVVLLVATMAMIGVMFVLKLLNRIYSRSSLIIVYAIPFIAAAVYTLYEVYQAAHPRYPDNFVMDMQLAWAAAITIIVCLNRANKIR